MFTVRLKGNYVNMNLLFKIKHDYRSLLQVKPGYELYYATL